MVQFVTLSKVVLSFESVSEILKCDHSNKKLFSSTIMLITQAEQLENCGEVKTQVSPWLVRSAERSSFFRSRPLDYGEKNCHQFRPYKVLTLS